MFADLVQKITSNGGTPLVVSQDDFIIGVIELQDIIKPGIQERFERLRKMGVKTVMVTGDNPLTAKYIAEKIVSEFPEACLIVEPNISQHPQFQLSETGYAYRQADIIAFLVAHKEFKTLPYDNSKLILDFCGIFKK